VADVLFGDYRPTGKLSVTFPRSSDVLSNVGDKNYDPLFGYGFGLSYGG
jgi:beta-glucosidase